MLRISAGLYKILTQSCNLAADKEKLCKGTTEKVTVQVIFVAELYSVLHVTGLIFGYALGKIMFYGLK